jgi:hypothetical protein
VAHAFAVKVNAGLGGDADVVDFVGGHGLGEVSKEKGADQQPQ